MKPPTIQQIEDYVREEEFHFSPVDFFKHYEDADPPWTYYDRQGKQKPVRNWKQKARNVWEKIALADKPHRCSHGAYGSCKKPGVYLIGKDRDGHPLYRCVYHKPVRKPVLPEELTRNTLKIVPENDININNERNRQQRLLR